MDKLINELESPTLTDQEFVELVKTGLTEVQTYMDMLGIDCDEVNANLNLK